MKKILFLIILFILYSCSKQELLSESTKKENLFHEKARAFRNSKITDSAFYYYVLAKDEYIKSYDSLRVGQCLVNMAIIETGKGDFYGSIETSLEANKFLTNIKDSINKRDLASSYNNMGVAYGFMYEYDNAIIFYKNAINYAINNKTKFTYYNNLGVAFLKKNDPKNAILYLKQAIAIRDRTEYSRALNNLAKAKYMRDNNYNPLPEFYKALKIREENNDTEGLNASYYTLSEYFKTKDKNKALFYTKKMLQTAIAVKNPEDKLQALIKLIELNPDNISKYFKEYQFLNDSLLISRNKAKNQFAYFRYGIEKEKTENLSLKADVAERENHIILRNIGIVTLFFLLIGGFFLYKKRKKRLEQEKELEVKNTQLKLSKKVHDVVANGIYQVMTKIENKEHFDKNEALDELEFVYEKSRDISYEKEDSKHGDLQFGKKISDLIASFKNDSVNTYIAGNDHEIWKDLKSSIQEEIFQITRELLVNMKKHSKADRVAFKFERINDTVTVQYTDNGIGISGEPIFNNGLKSTVSRIENIRGKIIFDTETEKGLRIIISFPAS
ncbi:tetratricopeptide repeat-containing sensor histidine kinase [Chryseobacterium sp. JUb7]|uniref:tetratricopeptide repeat-containing sensor histidine kinase n=1 Tax=Chryseobacterium sp. JUb7 TaxID=2940599 RepID=UPI00216844F3|nr:tetratricopeptide repeat-containing sensor histidine kinase [Chryseobacterium sp. JUb7]MCS3530320.1 tetratricopeptide (TPR) repeat protein [Chryseobacterium sp. JUb7]